MERHFMISERPMTFEELEELTRTNPRRTVQMIGTGLAFKQQGEFELSKQRKNILQDVTAWPLFPQVYSLLCITMPQ